MVSRIKSVELNSLYLKSLNHRNSFHQSLKFFIILAQCFALFPLTGITSSNLKKLKFSWLSFRTIYFLVCTSSSFFMSIMSILYNFTVIEFNVMELNVAIFYFRGGLTLLLFFKLARVWPGFIEQFSKVETIFQYYPHDPHLRCKLIIIASTLLTSAALEHGTIQVQNILNCLRCAKDTITGISDFFYNSYPNIFHFFSFSLILGVILQCLNFVVTFGWTYLDIFISLSSLTFASKLKQFKKRIMSFKSSKLQMDPNKEWEILREDFTKLLELFRSFNEKLDELILLSYATNLYFILTQLFGSLRSPQNRLISVYYVFTLTLLFLRITFVSLFGSSLHMESENIKRELVTTPSWLYCVELDRFIVEISSSPIILSGRKYFFITRGLILKMAGAIVTYELVMLQFSGNIFHSEGPNDCGN